VMIERALIVDDDPAMQRALAREVLKVYQVVLAGSAEEAIGIIGKLEGLRAVVSDLNMGSGTDGVRLLRFAQQTVPECARILVTGKIERDLAEELITSWAAHYVFLKPWDRGAIVHAIQEVIAFEDGARDAKSGVQLRAGRIVEAASMQRLG
jgi:DNA-binding NtrC family response regulator